MAKQSKKNLLIAAAPADAVVPPPAPAPAAPEQPWTPERVAADLGVSLETVEELQGKACVAGEDFILSHGDPVFTPTGLQKIRERLADAMASTPPAPKPLAATPAPAAVPSLIREDLTLTRVFRWSRNVLANRSGGQEVVLTVRNATQLQPGMVLRGCIKGELGWTYEGKLPRTLGERQLYFPPKPAAKTSNKQ